MKQKINIASIDESYKLLTGSPSMTAVSDAAKGHKPETDFKQFREEEEKFNDRQDGDEKCRDINEAYAMLFESLSAILRNKENTT